MSQRVLVPRMASQEAIGALHQHSAQFDGPLRQAQDTVPSPDHPRPHVVEEIGEQRERTGVLGRILRCAR